MAAGTGVQTQPYAQGQGRPMMSQVMGQPNMGQPNTGAPQMAPPTPIPNQGIPQPTGTFSLAMNPQGQANIVNALGNTGGDVPPTGGLLGMQGATPANLSALGTAGPAPSIGTMDQSGLQAVANPINAARGNAPTNTATVASGVSGANITIDQNDPRFQGMTQDQIATMVGGPGSNMQAAVMPGGQVMQAQEEGGYFGGNSPYTPSAGGGMNMFEQASDATSRAMQGSARELGYNPAIIQGGGYRNANVNAQRMGAAQVGQGDINRYMNPYTQSVIDQSMQDIERNRLIQANQAGAQAQAAGAFGGSRGALMESEIARNAMEQAARTASGLRSEGFSQASQLAQQDAARRQQAGMTNVQTNLQSQLANQAAQAQAQQFGLGQQMQASLANQAALLGGSQQRLNAANQLANIGNLGFGQAQSVQQGLQLTGAQQQAINQQLIDAARGQFQGYTGYPQQQLSYLAQALGASPMPQTTTTSSNPGAFGWLSMLLGSDVQFKENITPVGKTKDGHNLYMWDWNETAKEVLGETGSSMGVLAQEVMETNPELVVRGDHGYLMVNYGGIH